MTTFEKNCVNGGLRVDLYKKHYNLDKDYIAMAFSDDDKMGDDLAFVCADSWYGIDSSRNKYVRAFWNNATGNRSSKHLNDDEFSHRDLIKMSSNYSDGEFCCSFTMSPDALVKLKNESEKYYFDLSESRYLLLASGEIRETKYNDTEATFSIRKHRQRIASKNKTREITSKTENDVG